MQMGYNLIPALSGVKVIGGPCYGAGYYDTS